jgi:hypothetical protein
MAIIKREDVAAPADLKRETVPVPALGGDVVITELSLEDRLEFDKHLREASTVEATPGASPPSARAKPKTEKVSRRSVYVHVPQLLAMTVLADDDAPLFTIEQWRAFGARNKSVAIQLFNVSMALSGLGDAAKN